MLLKYGTDPGCLHIHTDRLCREGIATVWVAGIQTHVQTVRTDSEVQNQDERVRSGLQRTLMGTAIACERGSKP